MKALIPGLGIGAFFWPMAHSFDFLSFRLHVRPATCIYQTKDMKIFETSLGADFRNFGRRNFCGC